MQRWILALAASALLHGALLLLPLRPEDLPARPLTAPVAVRLIDAAVAPQPPPPPEPEPRLRPRVGERPAPPPRPRPAAEPTAQPAPEPTAEAAPEPTPVPVETAAAPALPLAAPAASQAAPAVPPTMEPAPVPVVTTAVAPAPEVTLRSWLAAVRARVASHRRYPRPARKLRLEGLVTVSLRVGGDGALLDVGPAPGHDSPALLLDAACAAVRAGAPYPPPPGQVPSEVDVPVRFALTR